ncbi:MAG TPA: biotin transporter BioY [Xanthobacteraceae bacterium]|nr:biotin transporter BioY [Xanthobacteraceae bacterium]
MPETNQTAARGRHSSLSNLAWRSPSRLQSVFMVIFGSAVLALSAKINVPLPYVPMTMQSLVVLSLGVIYGWRLGLATYLAYLAEGAMGLPVFAGPGAGPLYMLGSTGGFLVGFAVAIVIIGWLSERGWDRSFSRMFAAMALGHVAIFAFGFSWLAYGIGIGAEKAFWVGVVPFLAGAVVKNTLGALTMPALHRYAARRQ